MVADPSSAQFRNASAGRTTQARDAKRRKVVQLLTIQDVFFRDINDKNLDPIDRVNALKAWDIAEERIRILRGRVKPGSRNVSVREPHPSETKRLKSPAVTAHSQLYDYASEATAPIVPPPPADSSPT